MARLVRKPYNAGSTSSVRAIRACAVVCGGACAVVVGSEQELCTKGDDESGPGTGQDEGRGDTAAENERNGRVLRVCIYLLIKCDVSRELNVNRGASTEGVEGAQLG